MVILRAKRSRGEEESRHLAIKKGCGQVRQTWASSGFHLGRAGLSTGSYSFASCTCRLSWFSLICPHCLISESQSLRDVKEHLMQWFITKMKRLRPRQFYPVVYPNLGFKKKPCFNGIWLCLNPSRDFNLMICSIVCQ